MNKRVPPPPPPTAAPRISGVKFSAIAPSGVNPVSGTQFLAVTGGTTDNLYTIDQIAASVGSIGVPITLTGDVTGSGTGTIATTATGLHGFPVSSTTPTLNQVLEWTGAAWTPQTLTYGQMTWVPYTTLGQAFVAQNLTRDGDWTMVAKTNTTDRPSPQPSGAEEDLLPAWTPNRQGAVGALTIYNEWTTNTGGWIDQYGVDIIRQNVGDTHTITLSVNGSIRDTFTAVAANEGIYWHDILPIVVASGSVLRVTLQITSTGSNSWFEQVGLFATPPTYCSLAVGSLNGATGGTTAYNCHLLFTPGAASPDWDIVAFGGEAGGAGGGGPEPVIAWSLEGNPTSSTTTSTAFTIGSLTAKTTPASTDQLLLQDNAASGALKSVPWSSLPSGGGGGGMSIGGAVTGGTPKSVLFVDSGGNLAQDNPHLTFDPVSNYLNVGVPGDTGIYYVNGLPGIYVIPNASGNNWFEGNAGNKTLTGYGNFGTGDLALAYVTTGYNNFAIGIQAGYAILSAHDSYALGNSALHYSTTGAYNTAVGISALYAVTTESNNAAFGFNALSRLGAGSGAGGGGGGACLAQGNYAFANMETNTGSIAVGFYAGSTITTGADDIFIGIYSAGNATTSYGYNTFIGAFSGVNIAPGMAYNTILGPWRGPTANLTSVIAIAGGNDWNMPALDCGYTKSYGASGPWVWSFNTRHDTAAGPIGLHVYNTQDASPPTNFERACLDWNLTSNVFRLASQAGGTGTVRLIAIDGFQKAGAPAAGDLPSGTCALINDTSGGQTWLCYNAAGTIRKVQLT